MAKRGRLGLHIIISIKKSPGFTTWRLFASYYEITRGIISPDTPTANNTQPILNIWCAPNILFGIFGK